MPERHSQSAPTKAPSQVRNIGSGIITLAAAVTANKLVAVEAELVAPMAQAEAEKLAA